MGREFGKITTLKSQQVSWTLSPFEQKAFAGFFSKGIPRLFQRVSASIFRGTPFFIVGYLVYDWGKTEGEKALRKIPGQYDKEEP